MTRARQWRLDPPSRVTTRKASTTGDPQARPTSPTTAVKRSILRLFDENGCRVTLSSRGQSAEAAMAEEPDGIFLSNGPGDPDAVLYAPEIIRALTSQGVPTFGICLGHQLLGLTFGGSTSKMPYGHRGGNHPVKEVETGRVLITSQNHGFSVVGMSAR